MRTLPIDAVPIEYDLVIIGGGNTEAAQLAAQLAAQYHARVALVEPPAALPPTALPQICGALGRLAAAQQRLAALVGPAGPVDWSAITAATEVLAQRQQVRQDPSRLAALGVDCITGSGAFYRKPRLGFEVNGRQLRARAYLLVIGPTYRTSDPIFPPLLEPGFDRCDCLTPVLTPVTLVAALAAGTVGKTIALIGGDAVAVTLAQSLQRLGFEVILLTQQANILSTVDPEAAGLVQALLEAEGVQIWVQTAVIQTFNHDGQIRLAVLEDAQPGEIIVDTVVLATAARFDPAAAEALNLAATQVQWSAAGIAVDDRQRTGQRQIFACQDGLLLPQVIKNALFPLARPVDPLPVEIVDCDPPLASIGLTEAAARALYGTTLQVVRQPFYPLSQFQDAPTGFCKLMVRRNGKVVGGQIMGPAAIELAHTLALAIQSGLSLEKFAGLNGSMGENQARSAVFSQLAWQWQQSHAHSDWLEVWFDWCRSVAR